MSTASTWTRAHNLLVSARGPRADEEAIRDEVIGLVGAWESGLPIGDVRKLCTGYERWIAMRFSVGTSMRPRLDRMLAALEATDSSSQYGRHYRTPQGVFSEAELQESGVRMSKTADGKIRMLLPVVMPWRHKPDADRGFPGERGTPIYGETAEERHKILSIRSTTDRPERRVLD